MNYDYDEVSKLPIKDQLKFWLNWVMENCDSGPEWNFGSDATERINKLLKEA